MGKKELEAEIVALKARAERAENSMASWKSVADSRYQQVYNLQDRLVQSQADLARTKQESVKALMDCADHMAQISMEALKRQQHEAEIAIVKAERNAVANALKYTIDNLTLSK